MIELKVYFLWNDENFAFGVRRIPLSHPRVKRLKLLWLIPLLIDGSSVMVARSKKNQCELEAVRINRLEYIASLQNDEWIPLHTLFRLLYILVKLVLRYSVSKITKYLKIFDSRQPPPISENIETNLEQIIYLERCPIENLTLSTCNLDAKVFCNTKIPKRQSYQM